MRIWGNKIFPAFKVLVCMGIREGSVKEVLSELDRSLWVLITSLAAAFATGPRLAEFRAWLQRNVLEGF